MMLEGRNLSTDGHHAPQAYPACAEPGSASAACYFVFAE